MRKGIVLIILMMLVWSTSWAIEMPSETPEPESEMITREECARELTELWESFDAELMQQEREAEEDMRRRSAECEDRVRAAAAEGVEAGAAAAARPLLVEIAGLESVVARQRGLTVGAGLIGVCVGVVVGLLIAHIW